MLTSEVIRVKVRNGLLQPDLTSPPRQSVAPTGCQVKVTPNHLSGLTSTQGALGNMLWSEESRSLYIKFGH